ncbi:MAG: hypothetical protein VZR56_08485 [Treponema sp.]|nr:hypothetical protein [Treponema sp.]
MKKKSLVLFALVALCSVCYARSAKNILPVSWQDCILEGFPSSSPLSSMTAGDIFGEEKLITKEDVKNGGTYGVLTDYELLLDCDGAIFWYELWAVSNKTGMVGKSKKISDICITVLFFPIDESAIIYELEVHQVSTGMTKTFTYDGYIYDSEMMASAVDPILRMMVRTE